MVGDAYGGVALDVGKREAAIDIDHAAMVDKGDVGALCAVYAATGGKERQDD